MTAESPEAAVRSFLARLARVVDEMGLVYTHAPEEFVERSIAKFGASVKAEWREIWKDRPQITNDDIESTVDDLVARIRARRRQIESASALGRA